MLFSIVVNLKLTGQSCSLNKHAFDVNKLQFQTLYLGYSVVLFSFDFSIIGRLLAHSVYPGCVFIIRTSPYWSKCAFMNGLQNIMNNVFLRC